jgi:hypothetical protein
MSNRRIRKKQEQLRKKEEMRDTETANDQHNPMDNKPTHGNVNVGGTIQAVCTPSSNTEHKAERKEDKEYKDATRTHENRSITVAKVTTLISALYFIATCFIFLESKRSADTAKEAADISGKQLEMSERPWVKAHMRLSSPITFDPSAMSLRILTTLENTGHSPAVAVKMKSDMFLMPDGPRGLGMAIRKEDELCSALEGEVRKDDRYSIAVFPGAESEPVAQTWIMTVPRSEFERHGEVSPVVIGCVVYKSTFDDKFHRTANSFVVLTIGEKGLGMSVPVKNEGEVPVRLGVNFEGAIRAN